MEKNPAKAPLIILGAHDHSPLVGKARRLYRAACRENSYTRWLQPKQLLTEEARSLELPLSWTVEVEGRGKVSITPDDILGFDVSGSTRRVLFLSVDYGSLPVQSDTGDSLLLRTMTLVAATDLSSEDENSPRNQLRSGHFLILWLMQNSERLELLKHACHERDYRNVCLVEQETFFNTRDALGVKWHLADNQMHTLI